MAGPESGLSRRHRNEDGRMAAMLKRLSHSPIVGFHTAQSFSIAHTTPCYTVQRSLSIYRRVILRSIVSKCTEVGHSPAHAKTMIALTLILEVSLPSNMAKTSYLYL